MAAVASAGSSATSTYRSNNSDINNASSGLGTYLFACYQTGDSCSLADLDQTRHLPPPTPLNDESLTFRLCVFAEADDTSSSVFSKFKSGWNNLAYFQYRERERVATCNQETRW